MARGPWIIGGDFQQEPTDLLSWAAPMLQRCGGKLIRPEGATHVPGKGQERCIDYFIIDEALAGAVRGIRTQEELSWWDEGQRKAKPARPHKMVVLKLAHCGVPMLMQSIKAPRQFPRKNPSGAPGRRLRHRRASRVQAARTKRRLDRVS